MITTLAQATQQAPLGFDPAAWTATAAELFRALSVTGSTLVVGVVGIVLLRRLLGHFKLTVPAVVALVTLALYAGVASAKPERMIDGKDLATFWIHRVLAAVLLFVALRVLDRLVIVPILSRGGRVSVPRLLHQIINIVIAVFAVLVYGSDTFGWQIDKFLAGSAVVSIILGLALQETLGNFFSGLVMQGSPPFSIGDYIQVGEHKGRVVDINWRAVTIQTNEDNFVVIPNATVSKNDLINYHTPTVATARYVKVGLDYELPPCDALEVLKAAALETPGVLGSPEPVAMVMDFGDSAVQYAIKFWIGEPARWMYLDHLVRQNLWYRLKEKGYSIPFPIRSVEHVSLADKTAAAGAAAVRRREEAIDHVAILAPLSREQKSQVARDSREVNLAPGQVLLKQNDPGESFFIIERGQVEVLISPGAGPESRVATLAAGEFFGEMSVLTGQPRTATIRALSSLRCVEISKQNLHAIFEADPTIMEKISALVAERNTHRQSVAQSAAAAAATVTESPQKNLLSRMASFFRVGKHHTK